MNNLFGFYAFNHIICILNYTISGARGFRNLPMLRRKSRYRVIRYIFILYGRLRSFLPFPTGCFFRLIVMPVFNFYLKCPEIANHSVRCVIFVQVWRKRYNYSLYLILKNFIGKFFKIILTNMISV